MSDEQQKGIDESIRQAMERGDFDNLKGKGKPLNLDDYFDTPEDLRVAYSVLKNAGFVPEEIELLNEIKDLKEKLSALTHETERKKFQRLINEKQLKYDLALERFKGRGR